MDDIPIFAELPHEFGIVAILVDGLTFGVKLCRVNNLEIVNINSDGEGLMARRVIVDKDAAVRVIELAKAHDVGAPREHLTLRQYTKGVPQGVPLTAPFENRTRGRLPLVTTLLARTCKTLPELHVSCLRCVQACTTRGVIL